MPLTIGDISDSISIRKSIMRWRMLSLFSRACLGIFLILNGPAHFLTIGLASAHSSCSHDLESPEDEEHSGGHWCAGCPNSDQEESKETETTAKNDTRPTCPLCPSCPYIPYGCCVSCPCKMLCSPPVVFVIPQSAELAWLLTDVDISLADSHRDAPILPPRFSQFVAITS
jgi:hypothetical protein